MCQLASWFNAYCLTRTYSNSAEAALACVGTYFWLQARGASKARSGSSAHAQRAWLIAAGLSCVVRPPSALFWALPAALELARQQGQQRLRLVAEGLTAALACMGVATVIDRLWYGRQARWQRPTLLIVQQRSL